MKVLMLIGLIFLCSISGTARAQECDLEIRDGSAAKDLGRVLRCLDERLRNLESKARESSASGGAPAKIPGEFDAGSFAVSVRAASRQGDKIAIAIALRNKTTEKIFLAMTCCMQTMIDDNSGAPSTNYQFSGVQHANITDKNEGNYTSIAAGSNLNFSVSFSGQDIKGSTASLTLIMQELKNRDVTKTTVPLAISIRR